MQNNLLDPPKSYVIAGVGGAGIFAVLQQLGKAVLPSLMTLLNSLTGGGGGDTYIGCGSHISGENNTGNIVFCDKVNLNQFIDETLLLDINIAQAFAWEQIINNSLSLELEANTAFANTSVIYQLSQISKLLPVSTQSTTNCVLPHAEPALNTFAWNFSETEGKKKL